MKTILFKVDKIVSETINSKTFYLQPTNGDVTYEAGQFITLLLNINNNEVRRSYSLGSSPGTDRLPFITFKRVDNGLVSRYLFDKIKEGDTLEALPPSGRFTIHDSASIYFFIAAGSGITPVFSLIKELLIKQVESKVLLIYQNHNEKESIYRHELLALQSKYNERFKLLELFSNPIEESHHPSRLNNTLLEHIVTKHITSNDVAFYICGPISFMRMADFTLRVIGYNESQIRKEHFVVDVKPFIPLIEDTSPKKVIIHYNEQLYTIEVSYPHNILEAALEHGIKLPYSCRGGTCSTCSAKCVKGKVKMSINEVLTTKDLEQGFILTCTGYPETDIELEFD